MTSPGQRRYIEGRIAVYEQRARWLRHHCKTAEAMPWHHNELAQMEGLIAQQRAKLVPEEKDTPDDG